jgi:hypothetical protein
MSIIDDIIGTWSDMIDRPLSINKKQGFVFKNGMRIILSKSKLSSKSNERLGRHYAKQKQKNI